MAALKRLHPAGSQTGRIDVRRERTRRRGVGLLVVMIIVASSFALGYAMMRSQSTNLLISRNGLRSDDARHAALSGLNDALYRMHHDTVWSGADSMYVGNLNATDSFQVTYATGDATLSAADPNWADYPYRVTVTSRGFAMDPSNPSVTSIYAVQAVVQLVPRALSDPLQDWDTMQQYTVYQWDDQSFDIDVPFRAEGSIRLNGQLTIGDGYTWTTTIRDRYMKDLGDLQAAAVVDYRPFQGPVDLPFSETDPEQLDILINQLGVAATNTPIATPPLWPTLAQTTSYRLYPGGKTYNMTLLPSVLQDTTVDPNSLTNPLGLHYGVSDVTISDNVAITGSLVLNADVDLSGTSVAMASVAMPPLDGESDPVHLPPVACDDFAIDIANVDATIDGTVFAISDFEAKPGASDVTVTITGHLIARGGAVDVRTDWPQTETQWVMVYANFLAQEASGIPYFPVFMGIIHSIDPTPKITIKPDAGTTHHHFQDFNEPIYKVKSGDDGLIWDILRISENPL